MKSSHIRRKKAIVRKTCQYCGRDIRKKKEKHHFLCNKCYDEKQKALASKCGFVHEKTGKSCIRIKGHSKSHKIFIRKGVVFWFNR